MNKLKEKSKYIIGIVVTLIILIFGLNNIVYGKTLTFEQFAGTHQYACIQEGAPLRSTTSSEYPLSVYFSATYTPWIDTTYNDDGTVKEWGHYGDRKYVFKNQKVDYIRENGKGVPYINYYSEGTNGNVDSTHFSEDWQRAVAFVLYKNTGWSRPAGFTQSWIWAHVGDVISALGSSTQSPSKDVLVFTPTNYAAHKVGMNAVTQTVSVSSDLNTIAEPLVDDDMDENDFDASQVEEDASKYAKDGELGKYMEETKLPEIKNKGDNPVKTDNAKWVGPFTIEYDDTNKDKDYGDIFTENKPYAVSKLKTLTLEYLDGEKVSAPEITIRQNGTTFTDPNKIEKNVPFEIENLNFEKEVVNVHFEVEKWLITFFVNGKVWEGTNAEVDEGVLQGLINETKSEFESKYSEYDNFKVENTKTVPTPYIPQNNIEINNLGTRAEKVTVALDIPVEVKKGGIGIEKKGLYDDKEENLAGITFKLYCDTVGKYVKDIKVNAKSLTGTEIEFTESFDEAKPWVTGEDGKLLIDGLFAGEDYTYKLIEVDGGDNHYYDEPLKLSEAKGYTLGHIEQNGKKYCTVEGIKVKDGEKDLVEIVIKNDRTSGDLSIDKYDEKDELLKLKGAKFKIQLVKSDDSDPEHGFNIENKWLIPNGSAGNYDYTNMKHDEYLSDTEDVGEFVADENGHIDIKCIINGTYHVYETEGYWGYDIEGQDNDEHKYDPEKQWVDIGEVTVSKNSNHIVYDIPNIKTRGDIDILKADSKNGNALKDAEFKIYLEESQDYGAKGWLKNIDNNYYLETHFKEFLTEKEEDAGTFKTDENGKINIVGIPLGKYHIYETTGAIGYDIEGQHGEEHEYNPDNNWTDFGIFDVADGYEINKIEIKNDISRGNIDILKADSKNGNALKDAEFKIYLEESQDYGAKGWLKNIDNNYYLETHFKEFLTEKEEDAGTFKTDENGKINIVGVPLGKYHIYETTGAIGYDIEGQHGEEHEYNPDNNWTDFGIFDVADGYEINEIKIKNDISRGDIEILKSDSKNGNALKDAEFKIYLEESQDYGAKGWLKNIDNNYYLETHFKEFLTEKEEDAGTFKTDENGKINIIGVPLGKYHIYETTGAIGYDIEGQHGEEHEYNPDNNWTDFGIFDVADGYEINEIKIKNDISRGNIEIEKTDSVHEDVKLAGVEFKIYLEESQDYGAKGWLKNIEGNNYLETHFKEFLTEKEEDAGTFVTDENGRISIVGIPNGKYHVYETKMPIGYKMEVQDGYDSTKKWVDLGTIVVDSFKEEGSEERPTVQYQVSEKNTDTKIQNRKILGPDGVTGMVWIDEPDVTKGGLSPDSYDSLYGSGDTVLEGIKVTLYTEDGKIIARATTGKDGRYHIPKWNDDNDLYFWDLVNSYIEFVYDNKTYVCVNPFTEGKEKVEVNSKAQEYSLSKEELDDTKLTGTEGELSGKAVTKQHGEEGMTPEEMRTTKYTSGELSSHGLTAYYNDDNFTVENINLGLWKKIEPTYNIQETLEYSKVLMNGYTYTYDYNGGESGYADSNMVPSTYEQVSATYYGAKVYPSDIAYTAEGKPNGMEMYVVYKIMVTNTTTHHISNIYDELRLYLTSLTDTFDPVRYKLSTEHAGSDKWEGSQYFDLWKEADGAASYNISEDTNVAGDKINDGIDSGNSESVYIQFQVQQDFLEDMLAGTLTDERMNGAVTQAHATGHHAYKRTDNVWSKEESDKYYADSEARDQEKIQNEFLHRSVDVPKDAGALCLLFVLGEERTISGTVFEDTVTEESIEANENIGNGILNSEEGNRASGMKVELIDASTLGNEENEHHAVLYQHTGNNAKGYEVVSGEDTVLSTDAGGHYEFKGVVPGLYIIKLTYSDGSQKMIGSDGNEIGEITSNDYKSTIINTNEAESIIKDAMETKLDDMENYINIYKDPTTDSTLRESVQKIIEWYKYLYEKDPNNQYNIATDDLETRSNFTDYEYSNSDGTTVVKDSEGTIVEKFPKITSSTPYFSISIENDIEDYSSVGTYEDGYAHSPKYERFDLGLIKTTETNLILNKIISDIKLTNSAGIVLVQGDPREALNYVTALDNLPTGSQYTRVEMELENLYGTEVETTYRVKIDNDSVKDYIEDRENDHYGYYFKYGDKNNAYLKVTKVTEVIDMVDGDYDVLDGTVDESVTHPEESRNIGEETSNVIMTVKAENESKYLSFEDWEGIESGGWTQIEYRANGMFQEDRDLTYDNSARINKMKLDLGTTLRTDYVWGDFSNTRLAVTPDTGGDKRPTYIVFGVIALVVIAIGIVVIKKGILK